jgi:hypothetical protein
MVFYFFINSIFYAGIYGILVESRIKGNFFKTKIELGEKNMSWLKKIIFFLSLDCFYRSCWFFRHYRNFMPKSTYFRPVLVKIVLNKVKTQEEPLPKIIVKNIFLPIILIWVPS